MTMTSISHPLDPLRIDEIQMACELIKQTKQSNMHFRFAIVELYEPQKEKVLDLHQHGNIDRSAFIVVFDSKTGATFEAIVNLTHHSVDAWNKVSLDQPPYGQAPVLIEDFAKTERIVKADEHWRAAIKKRGLSDSDIDLVQVDLFSAGFFDHDLEKSKRVVRAVSYYRENKLDNGYARPIEGVVAVVDLINERVLNVIDDGRSIPIPKHKRNYHRDDIEKTRKDIMPLNITQPEGPSFSVHGWEVKWQKWSFRLGFTPREGIVLHQLSYQDGERSRPIIYRASVTEMVVPYADPTSNHFWKSAFDAGEYGLGRLANQLELGCDCLGHIRYFDIPAANDSGEAYLMKNAVCMHEEDYGVLWKHYEFRTKVFEVRRSRRLVVSFFATVGNYDYGFYWYFYQDGTIQLEAKLTGIIQTCAVPLGEKYAWGNLVSEGLGGPTHQHFFSVRMHMMLDGEKNSVTEHEFHPRGWGHDNPYGNVFDTTSRTLTRELDACREADSRVGRYWKIINPNVKNAVGNPTGYKLTVQPSPLMLAQEGSSVRQRGGFATKHLWVTRYHPNERYASGSYPNQHAGSDGLPKYVKQNRVIENEDIVLWHTMGHTHVCKPEDFPIMPVEYVGFMLKPNGFFDGNPAMDIPATRNAHSIQDGLESESCCSHSHREKAMVNE
jgi:primary-amine oxidase